MGKRHHGHVFMPGKFVFPGGRIDPADRAMPVAAPLDPRAERKLMLQRPAAERGQGAGAGARRDPRDLRGDRAAARRQDATTRPPRRTVPWSAFAEAKVQPDLSTMHFIARAITPPRRARRYDTRFFTADASAIAHRIEGKVGPEAELVELVWLPLRRHQAADRAAGDHRTGAAGSRRSSSTPASATTCRCRSIRWCTASGSGTCCDPAGGLFP